MRQIPVRMRPAGSIGRERGLTYTAVANSTFISSRSSMPCVCVCDCLWQVHRGGRRDHSARTTRAWSSSAQSSLLPT
eukprot:5206914-Amphidinium_carterae.1